MATEIERKFLVTSGGWREAADAGTPFRQGYLNRDPARTVRVRLEGARGVLTVKGCGAGPGGLERPEFEFSIPAAEAAALLDAHCLPPLIEKTRHRVPHAGHVWEVDVFAGTNSGLVLAELELARPDEPFVPPPWLGAEVTSDPRYLNVRLAEHPWRDWSASPAAAG